MAPGCPSVKGGGGNRFFDCADHMEKVEVMRSRTRLPWGIRILLITTACAAIFMAVHIPTDGHGHAAPSPEAGQEAAEEGASPFPERTLIRQAEGFTLEYHDTYKELRVLSPWRDARATFTYILVPRGRKAAHVPPGAMVVEIPLRRIALATTSCIPFLPMLHVERTLVGLSDCRRVSTPEIVEMIRRKQVVEIAGGGGGMVTELNMERLYALQPDAIFVYGTGLPEYDLHPKLLEAGFRTVIFASYMEPTPLGRVEWIKFLAAFFNQEREAERIFDEISSRYEATAEKVRGVSPRPSVFCGSPYRGLMYIHGGKSCASKLLQDAGADYLWNDDTSKGSIPLAVEAVVDRARDADFWLDPGACRSLGELAGADDRFSLFRPFRNGQVYNNNARSEPEGGNDYWETGEVRPDLALLDLVSIFHPELVPSHRRIWYRKLPLRAGGEK